MAAIARSYPGVLPGLNLISFNSFSENQSPLPLPLMQGTLENLVAVAGNSFSQSTNMTTSNGGTGTSNFNPFDLSSQPALLTNPNPDPYLQPINPPNPQLAELVALQQQVKSLMEHQKLVLLEMPSWNTRHLPD